MFNYKGLVLATSALLFVSGSAFALSDSIRADHDNECALYLCLPAGFMSNECSTPHKRFIQRMTDLNWKGGYNYTPLPNYLYCKNNESSEKNEISNAYAQLGQEVPESVMKSTNINYVWRIDAKVPEHKECTGWSHSYVCTNGEYPGKEFPTRAQAERKCSRNSNHPSGQNIKELTWCSSWKTVAKHYVENSFCFFGTGAPSHQYGPNGPYGYGRDNFKYDDHGQKVDSYNTPKWCDRTVNTVGVTVDGELYGSYYRHGDDDETINNSQNAILEAEQQQQMQEALRQNTELELKQAEEISNLMNDTSVQNQDNEALLKDLQEELKDVNLDH